MLIACFYRDTSFLVFIHKYLVQWKFSPEVLVVDSSLTFKNPKVKRLLNFKELFDLLALWDTSLSRTENFFEGADL